MDGIILINKPKGVSSFFVVKRIRYILKAKKVGHAGTLDPNATGLLVVLVGKYTKYASFLTCEDKVYETEVLLGIATDTDDEESEIIHTKPYDFITEKNIIKTILEFKGNTYQIPPKYSAKKINGRRAYDMARKGQEFSIPAKEVKVFGIDLLDINLPKIKLKIWCSKGFYVRSLARDLGEKLGTCAIASSIHRTKSGFFSLSQALDFEEINFDLLKNNIFELSLLHDKFRSKTQNSHNNFTKSN